MSEKDRQLIRECTTVISDIWQTFAESIEDGTETEFSSICGVEFIISTITRKFASDYDNMHLPHRSSFQLYHNIYTRKPLELKSIKIPSRMEEIKQLASFLAIQWRDCPPFLNDFERLQHKSLDDVGNFLRIDEEDKSWFPTIVNQ